MNYRHAYHAGNFADVLKHAVLTLVIEHLKQKPAAFRVIDPRSGAGARGPRRPHSRHIGTPSRRAGTTGTTIRGIGR